MAVAERVMPAEAATDQEDDGILYPWWDDEPAAQGSWHGLTWIEAMNMMRLLLADRPNARAFTDVFIYWERGDPKRKVAPDLFVLPDIEDPERERKSVRLWRERSRPVFVLEVVSDTKAHDDFGSKWDVYQDEIRVPEFFLVDPTPRPMRIWAYRLVGGVYTPVEAADSGRLWSEELRAWFGTDDWGWVQIWNEADAPMLKYRQLAVLAEQEARRAEEEARRREAFEARVRELEEEILRLKGGA